MNLIILAGGLGTRLNGTEVMPKPLVEIDESAMLTRIIKLYEQLNYFKKYKILITNNQMLYEHWKVRELPNLDIEIIDEGKRSGRTGALKYWTKRCQKDLSTHEPFFVCNADTIFNKLNREWFDICMSNTIKTNKPRIIGAIADARKDTKVIELNNVVVINDARDELIMNTGLFSMTHDWLEEITNIEDTESTEDIDHYLFDIEKGYIFMTTAQIIDIGTPIRLREYRRSVK